MGISSVQTEVVELLVQMPTPRHEKKVRKALEKMRGVYSVDIYYPEQRVTVTGYATASKVLKEARKVSKNAEMWCYQYGSRYSVYAPFESIHTPVFQEHDSDITSYYKGSHKHKHAHSDYGYGYGYGNTSSYSSYNQVLPYDHDYGYDHNSRPAIDDSLTTMFSDENATNCSIM